MARLHFDSSKKRFRLGMRPLVDTVMRQSHRIHSWRCFYHVIIHKGITTFQFRDEFMIKFGQLFTLVDKLIPNLLVKLGTILQSRYSLHGQGRI